MMRNSWNLDATAAAETVSSKAATAASLGSPSKKMAKDDKVELRTFNSESQSSPFKVTIAERAAEQPLVKEIKEAKVEAPYYTQEEEKKLGNIAPDTGLLQKTDNIVLERFRSAILARGTRGLLGIERQFRGFAKASLLTVDDFKQTVENFRLPL